MRSGRALIIASYNGKDRHNTGFFTPYEFLDIHFQQLQSLRHNLDKVLIVVNESDFPTHDITEFDRALKQFDFVKRPNDQGSYGAWKHGFQMIPDYEWYFFLEDDYTFFLDDFDQKWIDLWKPGTSYIATKVGQDWGYPLHTSISNGLTRGDILSKVDWSQLVMTSEYDAKLQLGWSSLFDSEGLADIRSNYASPYWTGNAFSNYSQIGLPVLIGPAQLLKLPPIKKEVDPMRHKQRLMEDFDYQVRMNG